MCGVKTLTGTCGSFVWRWMMNKEWVSAGVKCDDES